MRLWYDVAYTVAGRHVANLDEALGLAGEADDDDGIDWQPLTGPQQLLAAIED